MKQTVQFTIEHRKNTFSETGIEWALNVRFEPDGHYSTIIAWGKKPDEQKIFEAKEIAMRSMRLYHNTLKAPEWTLEKED